MKPSEQINDQPHIIETMIDDAASSAEGKAGERALGDMIKAYGDAATKDLRTIREVSKEYGAPRQAPLKIDSLPADFQVALFAALRQARERVEQFRRNSPPPPKKTQSRKTRAPNVAAPQEAKVTVLQDAAPAPENNGTVHVDAKMGDQKIQEGTTSASAAETAPLETPVVANKPLNGAAVEAIPVKVIKSETPKPAPASNGEKPKLSSDAQDYLTVEITRIQDMGNGQVEAVLRNHFRWQGTLQDWLLQGVNALNDSHVRTTVGVKATKLRQQLKR